MLGFHGDKHPERTKHHHKLHKQQTEGKIRSFVQHSCTNKYLKESKLNSDSNLSTCKHKSGQDSGAPNSHWTWDQEKPLDTQAMLFSLHFSWKKYFGLNWLRWWIVGSFWTRRKCHFIAQTRECKHTKSMLRKGRATRGVWRDWAPSPGSPSFWNNVFLRSQSLGGNLTGVPSTKTVMGNKLFNTSVPFQSSSFSPPLSFSCTQKCWY